MLWTLFSCCVFSFFCCLFSCFLPRCCIGVWRIVPCVGALPVCQRLVRGKLHFVFADIARCAHGPCSIRLWKNITTGVFPPGVLMSYCFHPIAVGSLSRGTSSLSRNLIQQSAHRDSRRFFSLKCQLRWCFPMWAFMYFWVVSVGASGYPICFSPFPIFECFRPFPPPDVICFSFFCLLFWSLDLWFKKAARYVLAIFHLKR